MIDRHEAAAGAIDAHSRSMTPDGVGCVWHGGVGGWIKDVYPYA